MDKGKFHLEDDIEEVVGRRSEKNWKWWNDYVFKEICGKKGVCLGSEELIVRQSISLERFIFSYGLCCSMKKWWNKLLGSEATGKKKLMFLRISIPWLNF